MLNENVNAPPLYIPTAREGRSGNEEERASPSSGVILSSKFKRSAGSAKVVCMVEGRSSSVKS